MIPRDPNISILHFILGKANKDRANGVNQVIAGLVKYCVRQGAKVRVIGKAQSVEHEGGHIIRDGFVVEAYSKWRSPLRKALIDGIARADIVHLHGAFSPGNLWVARLCRQQGKPFVLTLHNGLSPDLSMAKNRFKNKIFHHLLQKKHINAAAGVHVLTEEESTDLFHLVNSINVFCFCIPNGIDLDDFPPIEQGMFREDSHTTIGYLGRLSKEKNLSSLCEAFKSVNTNGGLRLKFAGPDSTYAQEFLHRYSQSGIELVGPKFGQERVEFIKSLDLFVLPSLSEGFSMAALEVLALGVPLLITRTSKMSYFYDSRAFFMCEPTFFGIERGLHCALAQRSRWPEMTVRGRELIEQRLNWSELSCELLKQYQKILSVGKA